MHMRDNPVRDVALLGGPGFAISWIPRPFGRDWTILGRARGLSRNWLAVPFLRPSSLLDRSCRGGALVGLKKTSCFPFEEKSFGSELLK